MGNAVQGALGRQRGAKKAAKRLQIQPATRASSAEPKKQVMLRLDATDHTALRVKVAKDGTSVQHVAETLLRAYIAGDVDIDTLIAT
ncbi:hypothetical protein [uncultured Brevibacterium sp.]|jgi:predicted HicB family RNase H-like nuclease|uniref:hypothetical protein n=1 Tax=uncultured Brevibacterium sp. TaxID=189678 RepID=UPI0025F70332|nr:hypothetical protein [uncultured Brevibacterium sp.]